MTSVVRNSRLAWNNVDLDELCSFKHSGRTLLSFEGLGARARADLENSIATSIPVFF
jgi:hypothetical protein